MKRLASLVLVGAVLGVSLVSLGAQGKPATPAPTVAAPSTASTPPKLDPDDALMVQGVVAFGKLANEACQSLDPVKQYTQQIQQVSLRLEAKYPGYTYNWQQGGMMAKAPPVATAK